MFSLISFFIAILFAFQCKKIALRKNKNERFWFIIGFLFGILGLIILLILPQKQKPAIKQPVIHPFFEKTDHHSILWFYIKNEQAAGPFSLNRLKQDFLNKKISADTYVWNEKFNGWKKIKECE